MGGGGAYKSVDTRVPRPEETRSALDSHVRARGGAEVGRALSSNACACRSPTTALRATPQDADDDSHSDGARAQWVVRGGGGTESGGEGGGCL